MGKQKDQTVLDVPPTSVREAVAHFVEDLHFVNEISEVIGKEEERLADEIFTRLVAASDQEIEQGSIDTSHDDKGISDCFKVLNSMFKFYHKNVKLDNFVPIKPATVENEDKRSFALISCLENGKYLLPFFCDVATEEKANRAVPTKSLVGVKKSETLDIGVGNSIEPSQ